MPAPPVIARVTARRAITPAVTVEGAVDSLQRYLVGEAITVRLHLADEARLPVAEADGISIRALPPNDLPVRSYQAEATAQPGTWSATVLLDAAGRWVLAGECTDPTPAVAELAIEVAARALPPLSAPPPVSGTAAGSLPLGGGAAGAVQNPQPVTGQAAGTLPLGGGAAGTVATAPVTGAGSGTLPLGGSAAGTVAGAAADQFIGVTLFDIGPTGVSVVATPPAGYTLTDIEFEVQEVGTTGWSEPFKLGCNTLPFNRTVGLKPGTDYDLRVVGVTGGTYGAWVSGAFSTTLSGNPAFIMLSGGTRLTPSAPVRFRTAPAIGTRPASNYVGNASDILAAYAARNLTVSPTPRLSVVNSSTSQIRPSVTLATGGDTLTSAVPNGPWGDMQFGAQTAVQDLYFASPGAAVATNMVSKLFSMRKRRFEVSFTRTGGPLHGAEFACIYSEDGGETWIQATAEPVLAPNTSGNPRWIAADFGADMPAGQRRIVALLGGSNSFPGGVNNSPFGFVFEDGEDIQPVDRSAIPALKPVVVAGWDSFGKGENAPITQTFGAKCAQGLGLLAARIQGLSSRDTAKFGRQAGVTRAGLSNVVGARAVLSQRLSNPYFREVEFGGVSPALINAPSTINDNGIAGSVPSTDRTGKGLPGTAYLEAWLRDAWELLRLEHPDALILCRVGFGPPFYVGDTNAASAVYISVFNAVFGNDAGAALLDFRSRVASGAVGSSPYFGAFPPTETVFGQAGFLWGGVGSSLSPPGNIQVHPTVFGHDYAGGEDAAAARALANAVVAAAGGGAVTGTAAGSLPLGGAAAGTVSGGPVSGTAAGTLSLAGAAAGTVTGAGGGAAAILRENGEYILREDGSRILTEKG